MCLTKGQLGMFHSIPCRQAKVERLQGVKCFYRGFGKENVEVPCFWEDKVLETWSKAASKHSAKDEVKAIIEAILNEIRGRP